ncbi:kynurenine--oxoglutarate transaminase 3 [Acyrthosiphon pisum]|uniref:Aminotransferase class I/classII large domain-containing protein n=1 Tax=Acyrthosiphon pisum TaxID=7029 RepID=A0A8R2A637_ACYPI|nr:kynurenine--oxoglutarate transaminase 3 [Acyrthosiphon pisum]|eukprot:XP_001951376.2 PREDICTED: kynurenine--oxoglutarate transaminase 3 [Acyrthosiphon pisum]
MVILYISSTIRANSFRTITNCLLKKKISTSVNMTSKIIEKFKLPSRHEAGVYNVWIEFSQLAVTTKCLNLGQGFPDYDPPSRFSNFLSEVATEKNSYFNQYTRGFGHMRLVRALSNLYSQLINRKIDPANEILVTVGAYEALYCAIQSNIEEGDEAIIIEPFYDCYEPIVRTAGGTPRFIPLRNTRPNASIPKANDWKLDPEELASLFNSKTKLIIINTPHNPLGKVFDYDELTMIADLAKKHNVLVISDEVYEWLVYEPTKHIRMATLPDMWERTITIGSAGKTFSMTGWKLGWAYGPANFIKNLCVVHQTAIYTCATTVQEATARGFEHEINALNTPESYFQNLSKELKPKMQYLFKILQDNGLQPIMPEGGYFMISNWTNFENKLDLSSETDKYKDFRFVKWLSKNVKLQGIPFSAFYSEPHKNMAENYLRFCFFKKDETLNKAEDILTTWTRNLSEQKSKL